MFTRLENIVPDTLLACQDIDDTHSASVGSEVDEWARRVLGTAGAAGAAGAAEWQLPGDSPFSKEDV